MKKYLVFALLLSGSQVYAAAAVKSFEGVVVAYPELCEVAEQQDISEDLLKSVIIDAEFYTDTLYNNAVILGGVEKPSDGVIAAILQNTLHIQCAVKQGFFDKSTVLKQRAEKFVNTYAQHLNKWITSPAEWKAYIEGEEN
jgi:hypothetical protein